MLLALQWRLLQVEVTIELTAFFSTMMGCALLCIGSGVYTYLDKVFGVWPGGDGQGGDKKWTLHYFMSWLYHFISQLCKLAYAS